MRKYLVLLIVWTKISFVQAQTTSDTICLDVAKYKKVYTAALQKKVVDSLLSISNAQLSELRSQVALLEEKDIETRNNFNRQIANLEKQIELYKEQITGYEALVKKERRRRRLATFGGILTTGIVAYIAVTK